jgi:hypothetical protein
MFADLKNSYQESIPRKTKLKDAEKKDLAAEITTESAKKYTLENGFLQNTEDITAMNNRKKG